MFKKVLLVLSLLAACVFAHGQDFYHRPGFLAGRSILSLSLFDEVQTELKTPADFKGKAEALLTKMSDEVMGVFQSSSGDLTAARPAIEKITNHYDDEVLKLLAPDQVTRIKQLYVQFNGNSAISNPAIETDLVITDDEKKQIGVAQDDNMKKLVDVFQSGGSPEDNQGAMEKLRNELGDAMYKVLTDDQKAKFKAMSGSKFEFKKVGN